MIVSPIQMYFKQKETFFTSEASVLTHAEVGNSARTTLTIPR